MSRVLTYRSTAVLAVANAAVYIAAWAQGADIASLKLSGDFSMAAGHPWTLLTYMFCHNHPGHLAINLAVLAAAGTMYERRRGHAAMLGTYITGGIAGGIIFVGAASAAGLTHASLAGASAAVLAVGTALITSSRRAAMRIRRTPAAIAALGLAAIAILWGLRGPNAGGSIAHIGGISAGIACGLLSRTKRTAQTDHSAIIEKARTSGYASLTDDERKKLADTQQIDS